MKFFLEKKEEIFSFFSTFPEKNILLIVTLAEFEEGSHLGTKSPGMFQLLPDGQTFILLDPFQYCLEYDRMDSLHEI